MQAAACTGALGKDLQLIKAATWLSRVGLHVQGRNLIRTSHLRILPSQFKRNQLYIEKDTRYTLISKNIGCRL